MAEDIAAVRKELQQVKQRAVQKIKGLTSEVEALKAQLAERPVPPPVDGSDSSADGSEAFVKIGENSAQLAAREQELIRREQELNERERELNEREQRLDAGAAGASASAGWHAQLISGLRGVNDSLSQAQVAAESVGVMG